MCSSCQSGRSQAAIDYILYQTHAYCGARCGCKACLCRSQPARFESQLHTSCTLFFIITYFINSIPYIGLARGCSAVVTLAPCSLELLGSKPVCGWRCLFFAKFIFNSYVQDNASVKHENGSVAVVKVAQLVRQVAGSIPPHTFFVLRSVKNFANWVDEVALLTTFDIHPSALDFFFLLFFDRYSFCCSASTFFS